MAKAKEKIVFATYIKLKAEFVKGKYDKKMSEEVGRDFNMTTVYAEKFNKGFAQSGLYLVEQPKEETREVIAKKAAEANK